MKKCKQCEKELKNQKNIFCSSSCAAKYNNPRYHKKKDRFCLQCEEKLLKEKKYHNKFCDSKCSNLYKFENVTLKRFNDGNVSKNTTLRKILINLYGNYCFECKQPNNWNEKELILEVDHIDGNSDNNLPKNLRLLCPNCHSQMPTSKCKHKKKNTKRNNYLRKFKQYET